MSWEEVACRPVGLPADRNVRLYDEAAASSEQARSEASAASRSSFGAADGTIWLAGGTREGRELLLRIVHAGREPARVSVWSEQTRVADEPASGELQLR